MNDYFYTAARSLVEREILELPDGLRFFPEGTVSGIELNEIIKKLKRLYPE